MPTYEYLCQTCSHRFETWQKMTDEPLTTCPQCGESIRRVIFPAGVVFKGHGFYKTDHSPNGKASTNGHDESANGDSKKAEPTTSEGKTSSESSNKPAAEGSSSTKNGNSSSNGSSTASSSESKASATAK